MGSNALRSGAVASLRPHRLLGEYRPWVGVSSLPSSCRRKYLVRCCIYPDTPVWMIVVDNEKQERLVLVTTLQNLVALASLAWGLLAAYRGRAPELIQHARRQKRSTRLLFPFYNLQGGGLATLVCPGTSCPLRAVAKSPWVRGADVGPVFIFREIMLMTRQKMGRRQYR